MANYRNLLVSVMQLLYSESKLCTCFFRILVGFTIVAISSCAPQKSENFSIYLLDEDISALNFSKVDIEEVTLESTPIISIQDFESYELSSHSMKLTPGAYRRLQRVFPKPVKVSGIPFVVCVGSQRIYSGAFWTPASSISYDGVVILQSFADEETTIHLTLGYPGPDAFIGSDPRADPRILRALDQANKLKSVPE